MEFGSAAKSKKRVITYPHIENEAAWPKADSGKVCLFEAVNLVGFAKFGSQWTGSELTTHSWPHCPEQERNTPLTKAPAPIRALGGVSRSVARTENTTTPNPGPDEHVHLVARAWEERRLAESAEWRRDTSALSRLTEVADWLAGQSRDGHIRTYWRAAWGGPLTELRPDDWFVDLPLFQIFASGGFARWQNSRSVNGFVFVERANLEKAIMTLSHAPTLFKEMDLDRLSPFLKLAVQLAIRLEYTSQENAETAPVREAHIRGAWATALPELPESETTIKAIAKVMGFPRPEAMKQGQRGVARKNQLRAQDP